MLAIIPHPAAPHNPPPDIGPLRHVLASSHPGLWAEALPGETPQERAARRDAAGDILDDLLTELADELDLEVAA